MSADEARRYRLLLAYVREIDAPPKPKNQTWWERNKDDIQLYAGMTAAGAFIVSVFAWAIWTAWVTLSS